jgi:hypothetical protein
MNWTCSSNQNRAILLSRNRRSATMNEIYQTFAADINRDRLREADHWRLAKQVRRSGGPTVATRLRGRLASLAGQRAAAPTLKRESSAGCS